MNTVAEHSVEIGTPIHKRVYRPSFFMCCERATLSVDSNPSYVKQRLAVIRDCCVPGCFGRVPAIMEAIHGLQGVDFVTIFDREFTVQFARSLSDVEVQSLDKAILAIIKRHPNL